MEQLRPLEIPRSECWVRVQHAPPYKCRLRLCVIPIYPALGMGLWGIRYSLAHGVEWGADVQSLTFQLLDRVLHELKMHSRYPSPLKQRLVSICLWLLSNGLKIVGSKTESKEDTLKSKCVDTIKKLKDEFEKLYTLESETGEFTLYLQKVLDMLVTSEPLRGTNDRIVQKFDVKAPNEAVEEPEEEEEEEEDEGWNCAFCTFFKPPQ